MGECQKEKSGGFKSETTLPYRRKFTLVEPAGVALAAAFFVDYGGLDAFGAEVADAQQGLRRAAARRRSPVHAQRGGR